MQPKKTNTYNYDSVKAHYDAYKDSIVVDYTYSVETGWKTVWAARDGEVVVENTSYIALQNYIVPAFFAIIITFFIFGALVMRDNSAAQRSKEKETILGFINKKK
jgi:hypothetical protein